MFKHLVAWNYNEDVTPERREELNEYFAKAFPELKDLIPGIQRVVMLTPPHKSSTRDLALYIEMDDEDAFYVYEKHPEHIRVAQVIRANCHDRCSVNFED